MAGGRVTLSHKPLGSIQMEPFTETKRGCARLCAPSVSVPRCVYKEPLKVTENGLINH